ncbi:hypothetical protein [Pseudoflavonifractor phocaeensis]|uniref:hypothetical protein n=1 Tax=Pseudoflavonifractor phocaeensis TaxID=1870988 RepID=UPI001959991A|nr:hypothetical protein [Pseudoflavonifractor phocaeensis]MBM6871178.1 hypothetical protein [Pseudoflavonifractor phocaeensis]
MIGAVSFITCFAGIICFFFGAWQVTVAGAVVNLISQFLEILRGKQTGAMTAIIACLIGLALSVFAEIEWWLGICAALCFENVLLLLVGIPSILAFFFYGLRNGKKQ